MALTKFNFNSFDVTTAASSALTFNSSANGFSTASAGAMNLIKTQTASSSSSLSFIHGTSSVVFDNTYDVYLFKFINCHPATNDVSFTFNATTDGSNFNITKTTTAFAAYQGEGGGGATITYDTSRDIAQGTGYQELMANGGLGNGNDESTSGQLYIFAPYSTTFVKHFIATLNVYDQGDYSINPRIAGYFNTTSALTGLDFKMSSGNIDSGVIKMYGITK